MRKKDDNRIKIQVIGPPCVGKSTVVSIVAKALAEAGLKVDSFNSDIPQLAFVEDNYQELRVRAIKDVKIDIEEILTRPNSFTEVLK